MAVRFPAGPRVRGQDGAEWHRYLNRSTRRTIWIDRRRLGGCPNEFWEIGNNKIDEAGTQFQEWLVLPKFGLEPQSRQRTKILRCKKMLAIMVSSFRLHDSHIIARLWPDACQDDNSDKAQTRREGQDLHWDIGGNRTEATPAICFQRLDPRTLEHLNIIVATALMVMLIATAPEEVGLPECTDTVEAAGLKGPRLIKQWNVDASELSSVHPPLCAFESVRTLCAQGA